jgi:nucleoside-diphosphate-sugar epimerase
VLGVARRLPDLRYPKTDWAQADVSSSELQPLFRGADVVVHLASEMCRREVARPAIV